MTDLRVVTTEGNDKILEEAVVQGFGESLRGPLLRPGDGGYDEARKVWNGMNDRRPARWSPAAPGLPMSSRRCALPAPTSCWCPSAAAVTTSPATPSARAA
jgi:hypothetical protein